MNILADFQGLFSLNGLISLIILSILELVLGVDNIIFISLVLTKLPEERRFKARIIALSLAFIMRVIMLYFLVWLSRITTTLFFISTLDVSVGDILYFIGGAYLTISSVMEIIKHLDKKDKLHAVTTTYYRSIILQIVFVDMLFSFDTIFTAIGISPNFIIMVLAVAIGMVFMIYISVKLSGFLEKHPTIKTLALSYIIAVGLLLITKALHVGIPMVFFYAATTAFIVVALLSFIMRPKKKS